MCHKGTNGDLRLLLTKADVFDENSQPVETRQPCHTLPTEKMVEDTVHRFAQRGGQSNPSVASRCGGMLPSASADVRSPDDVIAF